MLKFSPAARSVRQCEGEPGRPCLVPSPHLPCRGEAEGRPRREAATVTFLLAEIWPFKAA